MMGASAGDRPTTRRRWKTRPPSSRASTFAGNAYEVAEGADALVLLTEWDEFRWMRTSTVWPA